MEEYIEQPTPEEVIRENISKANYLLDLAISNIESGNINPRMLETTAQLLNSITNATGILMSTATDMIGMDLKSKLVELKEKELEMKNKAITEGGTKNLTQNLIVASHSELMKLLNDKKE
jgi:hypothetical protein